MNYDIQLRFAPSEAFVGILAELKFMPLFPSSGTAAALDVGYTIGL